MNLDLDNTLYPAECNLFAQIDQRMSAFIQDLLGLDPVAARKVQKDLYYEHGTTLSGLMAKHDVKPDAFMDFVHDIDLAPVSHMPELAAAISRLEGRKFIFTNGSARHAERVAGKLGVLDAFDGIFDIAAGGYVRSPGAFLRALSRFSRAETARPPCSRICRTISRRPTISASSPCWSAQPMTIIPRSTLSSARKRFPNTSTSRRTT